MVAVAAGIKSLRDTINQMLTRASAALRVASFNEGNLDPLLIKSIRHQGNTPVTGIP